MIPIVPYGSGSERAVLQAHGVMCVVGMFSEQEARGLREHIEDNYRRVEWRLRDIPSGALPRYLLMKHESVYTREVFRRLGEFRNMLAGQPVDWALRLPQDGWWTDARFNLYPLGGGFMGEHRDQVYVGGTPPGGFVQPILLLSQPGEHYREGGAYVRVGEREYLADRRIGDVLVYRGDICHGVKPVHLVRSEFPDSLDTFHGRLVACVTPLRTRV